MNLKIFSIYKNKRQGNRELISRKYTYDHQVPNINNCTVREFNKICQKTNFVNNQRKF